MANVDSRRRNVGAWTKEDLDSLPTQEDDGHEYKSSEISDAALKKGIGKAASGFWNSGGGLFVAGLNDKGKPDGGIARQVGRQSRRDWVDQLIHEVEPVAAYSVAVIELEDQPKRRIVLVLDFAESHLAPHMAPDHRYYVRAGAHTVPARHALVEAIRARRGLLNPVLRIIFRLKPENPQAVQLGVVAVSDAPALDVSLELDPLPEMWKGSESPFPLRIAVVDKEHPFFMDLTTWTMAEQRVGKGVMARLRYEDLAGRKYEREQELRPSEAVSPWMIGSPNEEQMRKSLDKLVKAIQQLARSEGR